MPRSIEAALACTTLGCMLSLPCLIHTTPLTMVCFFLLGIPVFACGFLLYLIAVVRDLRHHDVI